MIRNPSPKDQIIFDQQKSHRLIYKTMQKERALMNKVMDQLSKGHYFTATDMLKTYLESINYR